MSAFASELNFLDERCSCVQIVAIYCVASLQLLP